MITDWTIHARSLTLASTISHRLLERSSAELPSRRLPTRASLRAESLAVLDIVADLRGLDVFVTRQEIVLHGATSSRHVSFCHGAVLRCRSLLSMTLSSHSACHSCRCHGAPRRVLTRWLEALTAAQAVPIEALVSLGILMGGKASTVESSVLLFNDEGRRISTWQIRNACLKQLLCREPHEFFVAIHISIIAFKSLS